MTSCTEFLTVPAVGLSRRQNVYPADIGLVFPVAATGRRRQYHMPDRPPVSAEAMLSDEKWRKISWRRGTKGRLTCFFAARRVRIADGHKHRMLDNRMQCMPGDEVWLVGERRSTGEQKYYVSNLPVDATLKALAAAIKARWICEHRPRRPMYGLMGWRLQRHRNDGRRSVAGDRHPARWPGLVAEQAGDALGHEPLLPAPDRGLRCTGCGHDSVRADAVRAQKDDPGAPVMLLRRVAVGDEGFESLTISLAKGNGYTCAHARASQARISMGILRRTQPSRSIH